MATEQVRRSFVKVLLPEDWPEYVAYAGGRRLFRDGLDEVPTLLRQGLPIQGFLLPGEIGAMLELGVGPFERWLREGWRAEASREA